MYLGLFSLTDSVLEERYISWQKSYKYKQIFAASILTAILYIMAYIIEFNIVHTDALGMMKIFHLYIIPPSLLFIAYLAYKNYFYTFVNTLLLLAPLVAYFGNIVITKSLENPTVYFSEIYLIIIWTFTVSGLLLKYATISATLTYIMAIISGLYFFDLTLEAYIMHVFWSTAAYMFGFLSAYLLEMSSQTLFLKEEELSKMAKTDKLTGLFNRSKLDEVLANELNRTQRSQSTFGLVMLDIDYFKLVNDTYGHQVGDEVLIGIAKILKENIRSTDMLARWGGEEFILIYLNNDKEKLLHLVEELRQKIEAHTFEKVGQTTVSFGVTLYQSDDTVHSILKRADSALYLAKEYGRNRIEFV